MKNNQNINIQENKSKDIIKNNIFGVALIGGATYLMTRENPKHRKIGKVILIISAVGYVATWGIMLAMGSAFNKLFGKGLEQMEQSLQNQQQNQQNTQNQKKQ